MGLENDYARPHIARMFSSLKGTVWIPNINLSFAFKKKGVSGYISGCPDAFVCMEGRFIAIECKAFAVNVKLKMWSTVQERWWRRIAARSGMEYYIALWMYPEKVNLKDRSMHIYQEKAHLFLIPPEVWLQQKALATAKKRASVPLLPEGKSAQLSVIPKWERFKCSFSGGKWNLPERFNYD